MIIQICIQDLSRWLEKRANVKLETQIFKEVPITIQNEA